MKGYYLMIKRMFRMYISENRSTFCTSLFQLRCRYSMWPARVTLAKWLNRSLLKAFSNKGTNLVSRKAAFWWLGPSPS